MSPTWNYEPVPLPGGGGFDPSQQIAVVSRTPQNLDVFGIGTNGYVYTDWWSAADGWNAAGFTKLPGNAVFNRGQHQIAAVSRNANDIDLFVIGNDGPVFTSYWNGSAWATDFTPLPGGGGFDPSQHIAVVSRTPQNLDVFVIGTNGYVYTTWWNSTDGWRTEGFVKLPGNAVFNRGQHQIAAVSRNANDIDLFVIGNDGPVFTSYWNGSAWAADFTPLPGGGGFDPSQQIAVVSRTPQNLDVFAIGTNGYVYTDWWSAADGWNAAGFTKLPGNAVFNRGQNQISAVSRNADDIDLFLLGNDGPIFTSYWNGTSWNSDFVPLPGAAVFTHGQQNVAAVSRSTNNLDVFVVGNSGPVWTTFWSDQATPPPASTTWGPLSVTFADGTALGGPITITMNEYGGYTFSGKLHDSGADSYTFTLAAAVVTPSGIAYTLTETGQTQGTVADPLGSPQRDFPWTSNGNSTSIRDNWAQVKQARASWHIVSEDLLGQAAALAELVQQAVTNALMDLAEAGIPTQVKTEIGLE